MIFGTKTFQKNIATIGKPDFWSLFLYGNTPAIWCQGSWKLFPIVYKFLYRNTTATHLCIL